MKSVYRACVRAPLCNPVLLCVVQRLEHDKGLAFCKYAQCINNVCPCVAAAGKMFARHRELKDIGVKDTETHLIAVFCFGFCLF